MLEKIYYSYYGKSDIKRERSKQEQRQKLRKKQNRERTHEKKERNHREKTEKRLANTTQKLTFNLPLLFFPSLTFSPHTQSFFLLFTLHASSSSLSPHFPHHYIIFSLLVSLSQSRHILSLPYNLSLSLSPPPTAFSVFHFSPILPSPAITFSPYLPYFLPFLN